jgi:two-component system NtrC family response regulator
LGLEVNKDNQASLLKEAREQLDIKFIKEALAKNKGNVSRAAKKIGVSRVSFYDLMKKYGINVG